MTSNPLDSLVPSVASSVFNRRSIDELRDWCEDMNSQDGRWAKTVWYYTIPDPDADGSHTTVRVDGLDAEEIRKAAHGRFPEYAGWSPDKMRQHVGLIKYRLQMGMCQASFERISSRWRHSETARERQPEYEGAPL